MSHGGCHKVRQNDANGSKAATLLLRLSTLALALSSAVVMATASACIIVYPNGVTATVTYKNFQPFVYIVAFNIAVAVLEAVAIYLQLTADDGDDGGRPGGFPGTLLVVIDVAVQVLSFSATGALFAAVSAYGPQISSCVATAGRFCDEVQLSKNLSLSASAAAAAAAVTKDVPLPFSLWPSAGTSDDHC